MKTNVLILLVFFSSISCNENDNFANELKNISFVQIEENEGVYLSIENENMLSFMNDSLYISESNSISKYKIDNIDKLNNDFTFYLSSDTKKNGKFKKKLVWLKIKKSKEYIWSFHTNLNKNEVKLVQKKFIHKITEIWNKSENETEYIPTGTWNTLTNERRTVYIEKTLAQFKIDTLFGMNCNLKEDSLGYWKVYFNGRFIYQDLDHSFMEEERISKIKPIGILIHLNNVLTFKWYGFYIDDQNDYLFEQNPFNEKSNPSYLQIQK